MSMFTSPSSDLGVYLKRLKSLIDRRTKLEAVPRRAAGWVTEVTGETNGEA
jgi:site-specific DNA recombinase